jgi:succinoglycan biosynthesis protein ExoM
MRIAICIGTFLRARPLRELLVGISRLTFRQNPAPDIKIIVVDNDPLGSAQDTCQVADCCFPLRYVIEPHRGIAHVRNRAVREAGAVDFLAFIDDDEIPSPEWLDESLWAHSEYKAEIVTGPVNPEFSKGTPEWIRKGRFFERPEFQTGSLLEKCSTNNVLVAREVFDSVPGFDERFQLTGGEDSHFFLRARRAGFRIVWSQQAMVREPISPDRANLRWILHRGFQVGNSWVLCEMSFDDRFQVRCARFVKASVRLFTGAATTLASLFLGRTALARSLREAWVGAGMLAGLSGHQFSAYKSAGTASMKPVAPLGEGTSA